MADDTNRVDFPYYRGHPVAISSLQWLVPLGFVGVATWILLGQLPLFSRGYLRLAPGILLAILPLIGLALVAGRHWTAPFRKVGLKEIGWMFAFAALNYVFTLIAGLAATRLIHVERNAGISSMASDPSIQLLFLAGSLPQLLGEELITIIPFLAILYYCDRKLGLGRKAAILTAWVATAVWFALIHLPTYGGNLAQVLLLIGLARLMLTLAYLKTKNLWVSTGAHIINDWTTFGLVILGARMGFAT